jgi:hypothetical protein
MRRKIPFKWYFTWAEGLSPSEAVIVWLLLIILGSMWAIYVWG